MRCPYSNAVLKVWGEAVQRIWTDTPIIAEDILQSKRRRTVKQAWVGSEAGAKIDGLNSKGHNYQKPRLRHLVA